MSSCLMKFAIVIAIPRERESRPAPQAPVAPQLSTSDRHRIEIGECGLRPTGEARVVIEPLT
jgi:hypothetical protein